MRSTVSERVTVAIVNAVYRGLAMTVVSLLAMVLCMFAAPPAVGEEPVPFSSYEELMKHIGELKPRYEHGDCCTISFSDGWKVQVEATLKGAGASVLRLWPPQGDPVR